MHFLIQMFWQAFTVPLILGFLLPSSVHSDFLRYNYVDELPLVDDTSKKNGYDLADLYTIVTEIYESFKIPCSLQRSRFSDCFANAERSWGRDDVKSQCCKFWEIDICVQSVIDQNCTDQDFLTYTKNDTLSKAKEEYQDNYCESYPNRSSCDYPLLMIFGIVASVVLAVVLSGFAILKSFTRN